MNASFHFERKDKRFHKQARFSSRTFSSLSALKIVFFAFLHVRAVLGLATFARKLALATLVMIIFIYSFMCLFFSWTEYYLELCTYVLFEDVFYAASGEVSYVTPFRCMGHLGLKRFWPRKSVCFWALQEKLQKCFKVAICPFQPISAHFSLSRKKLIY